MCTFVLPGKMSKEINDMTYKYIPNNSAYARSDWLFAQLEIVCAIHLQAKQN